MRAHPFLPFLVRAEERPWPRGHDQVRDDPEASYRRLSNLALVGVYSCDSLGVIQFYNNRAAELWGRKPEIGDTDERFCGSSMLCRPDDSPMSHELSPMADVLSGKVSGVHDAELHIQRPDGSGVIVIVNIAPLTDDEGDIVGAMCSFYDVNDREDSKQ